MFRKLTIPESNPLAYDQLGAEYGKKIDALHSGGEDWTEYLAYDDSGSVAVSQVAYLNPAKYWIGIQNLSAAGEVMPVQARVLGETYYGNKRMAVGDDLSLNGTYPPAATGPGSPSGLDLYIDLAPGELIRGRFERIAIKKPGTLGVYSFRFIRGVKDGA